MKQVVFIHGGNSFNSYDSYRRYLKEKTLSYDKIRYHKGWKTWLAEQLPDSDVLLPSMPNDLNAVYDEWAIYFDKLKQFFADDVRLVGHSLGAMFLAKYLHQNQLDRPVRQLILLAGGYDDESQEELGSFRVESAAGLGRSAEEIHLFHSQDDPVVAFSELAKYQRDVPTAITHTFVDRGHFFGATPTFPELLELLQKK